MNHWWMLGGMAVLLFALAIIIPSNHLTGNVVQEGTCKGLGCVELCEQGTDAAQSTCGSGLVCCPTQWESGVCDYDVNCGRIREYSLFQSLETYQDSVRERPQQFDMQRFILPLVLVLGIIAYFALKKQDP